MSPQSLRCGCCAICAHNICAHDLLCIDASNIPLHLLRNDCLPEHTLPRTYDFELYLRAILYPKGLVDPPHQPLNSLANFQYYGHERLPVDIREAFSMSSIFDWMLVSRVQASQVTHFYTYKSSISGPHFWSAEEGSQCYNQGNIAICPQNSTELYTLLPLSPDELQEAMCVIFSGQKIQPSCDTVRKMGPVLVTKSRVQKLIYGVTYSQSNMDALFDEINSKSDTICHLPMDSQVPVDEGFRFCDVYEDDRSQVAAVGREKMKLHALTYVLDHKKFLLSRTGSKFVADNDPDPWGIGGFFHSAQVKNLLRQDDSPFCNDPHFARNTTFCIIKDLKEIWQKLKKKAARILRSICSLMKKFSTPALFVTLNPHDLTSSILPIVSSIKIANWSMIHPDAAAITFDLQIQVFVDIILKYKHGPGMFGHWRGTLHCHMFLPQALRDRITQEAGFKDKMFAWLESIISCELPNDKGYAKKPVRKRDEMDPWLETLPQVTELDAQSFRYEFREFLSRLAVECNWYHLQSGEKHADENCRMRLDGLLQDITSIDIETGSIKINNYMDLILFLMQSNTDTQFIGSGEAAKAAVFYITEYVTKGSLPMYIGLQALDYATKMHEQKFEASASGDIDIDQKNHNLITKSVNAMMGQQEISHQQVMSYLVGRGDCYTSHTFQTEEQVTVNIVLLY
ncbi:uncharacterized protein EDB93DRAFT_1238383 [Suillus bovinus]|uniref:uncharacterized protein n=1 Tax=Suillus bovinus TaxID=48563 RepID=UPI001B886C52|nr:uncharacterized protein EDB93DRAFT_1238383 [Suillus bovinus]KAG2158083.1 hypothetical protein EDB93DRAFT_1238383 [Suillus bovinus]